MGNGRFNGHTSGMPSNGHGFNLATVAQVLIIPFLSAAVIFITQWVTQGDEVKRHETALSTTIPQEFKEEKEAREKIRNDFLDRLTKLNDGISSLNTTIAVMAEQNKQIASTLQRLDKGR